jgi:hypothetical protein
MFSALVKYIADEVVGQDTVDNLSYRLLFVS